MKRIVSIYLSLCWAVFACAQSVSNVVAKQVGNTIEITYDLDKVADVSLLLSRDGGASYLETPKALSGDAGKNISAGHKKIVWDLLQESNDWDITRACFKVVIDDKSKKIFTAKGVSFTMVFVEGGTFAMGCTSEQGSDCYKDEKPSHSVTLSDYYIGQTEVTQALWKAVMGTNPSGFKKGDNYPVENISWEDCQQFVQRLNSLLSLQLGGKRFALPTEAQWEYAARGGKKSRGYKYSGSHSVDNVGWHDGNSGKTTHPVASKSPNELDIYDMSGNVWEWCQDWYDSYDRSSQSKPADASFGSYRVFRGGSWLFSVSYCRVSSRGYNAPMKRHDCFGLRLVVQ